MQTAFLFAALWLDSVPPRALVLAMLLSYALGFAGMLLAYWNYRKRRGPHRPRRPGDPQP